MQLFGLILELLKPPLGIDVDSIFGVFADVEALLERLRRSSNLFAHAFQTHLERRKCRALSHTDFQFFLRLLTVEGPG